MPKHTKQKPKTSRKLLYIKLAWVVAGVVALIVYELTLGGQMSFYAKWVECNKKPLGGHVTILGSQAYYKEEPAIEIFRLQRDYFCTPLEAEKAWYSASETETRYPHIRAERAEQRGE